MDKERQERYIENFRRLIRCETVSDPECGSPPENFEKFRELLWEMFPNIRKACELEIIDGAILLKWKGSGNTKMPVLFMNHHDVVPARAEEETFGAGARAVAKKLYDQGIRFEMVFDEGGDIVCEPISGAQGTFAMIGVGEKSVVNMKFTARSSGGHASTPEKNTPIVRLAKFIAYVERHQVFEVELATALAEMLKIIAPHMGKTGKLMEKADKYRKQLGRLMPMLGAATGAMVSTTIAFTMAGGGEAVNVIPSEAWVIGDMRCSHHQGKEASIKAISKIAKKFGVEAEVIQEEPESRLADFRGDAFRLVKQAVMNTVPGVDACAPYIMTGGSDSRFFDIVSNQCIRFLPFTIDKEQMDSIHGVNECVSIDTLVPAVDYYRYMYQHV